MTSLKEKHALLKDLATILLIALAVLAGSYLINAGNYAFSSTSYTLANKYLSSGGNQKKLDFISDEIGAMTFYSQNIKTSFTYSFDEKYGKINLVFNRSDFSPLQLHLVKAGLFDRSTNTYFYEI